jgi:hypothetical protein
MPRQLRIQYEGAIYRLMGRGDWREEIFRDDLDREDFLKTLAAAVITNRHQQRPCRFHANLILLKRRNFRHVAAHDF